MPASVAPTAVPAPVPPPPPPPEDLDMKLEDFGQISGLAQPPGRSYFVANPLGHEAEALAVASSASGGTFPVGSIVELGPGEVMVKRRKGFNEATNDWEFFGVAFAADGRTPQSFTLRGTQDTSCFRCHSTVSSRTWDFVCQHP
jgi:hypothetical protein